LDQHIDLVRKELANIQSPYRILGDVVDYGVWVCDSAGQNIYVSQSFLTLLGRPYADVAGLGWLHFLPPGDAEETQRLWLACVANGDIWNREIQIRDRDGFYKDILSRGKPVRNQAGEIVMWVGLNLDITDSKRTERALVESDALRSALNDALEHETSKGREDRDRLEMALSASGVIGTWYGDLKAGMVYGDENFARIYGFDHSETSQGKPLGYYFKFMHPDDLAGAQVAMDRMMAGSDEYAHEHRIIRPDGSLLWVMARGRLIRDLGGTPIRFPGVSVDITDRKLEERRETFLRELEERLRSFSDPRDVMFAAAEHLGSYLEVDRAGYAEIDANGTTCRVPRDWCASGMSSLTGNYRIADFGVALIEVLATGKLVSFEDALLDPLATGDNTAAMYEVLSIRSAIAVPLVRAGRFMAVFFVHGRNPRRWTEGEEALCRDVAERTWSAVERAKAEETALQNAAQFRTLSQAMANHVWTATPDGLLDWLNDRVIDYSGLEAHELLGIAWTSIVHPEDLPAVEERWRAALASGCQYETEFRLRRADGTYRWHIARAVPLHADGKIDRWIGTNTDIEDQKTIARALADLNANLEEQVQDRTRKLLAAEESLRQSQKMEAVGQLTGGLAHDFNNLLTGITGSLDLLETRISQGRVGEADRYIQIAQSAAKRAAALTHRLLAFSRRQTLDPRPTDIHGLVVGLEELIRRTVGPSIVVEVVGTSDLWAVLVDPHQLENAVLNLCINARDAMPEGGEITIRTSNHLFDQKSAYEADVSEGEYVLLSVSDTGCGMPPDVIERAFDPFFTTKPLGAGTGLGLSMVYGFVRQSGGQAKIYSESGRGAMVCLYLPRFFGDAEVLESAPDVANVQRAEEGETVLIVDDERTIRTLIAEVLAELGYSTLEAEDGRKGLKVLESSRRIDLLITDVGLPGGMNGRQLADMALQSRPDLKVLFITGYADTAVISDGQLQPRMHVVTKPFSLQMLAGRLKEIMNER